MVDLNGQDYSMGGVVVLSELETRDFPVNAIGMIMKIDLVGASN